MNINERRRELYNLLGDLPSKTRPISTKKIKEKALPHYINLVEFEIEKGL